MDATAWITLGGLVVTVLLAILGGVLHGVMLLSQVRADITHMRELLDGVKEMQDHHGERLDNHEVRLIRLESK